MMFLCRSVVEPQHDLGAQASPSRTRSSDPKVVMDSLADDARTATPPPAAGESGTTPPPVVDSGTGSPRALVTWEWEVLLGTQNIGFFAHH
jgi:hypothetical protein